MYVIIVTLYVSMLGEAQMAEAGLEFTTECDEIC